MKFSFEQKHFVIALFELSKEECWFILCFKKLVNMSKLTEVTFKKCLCILSGGMCILSGGFIIIFRLSKVWHKKLYIFWQIVPKFICNFTSDQWEDEELCKFIRPYQKYYKLGLLILFKKCKVIKILIVIS